MLIFVIGTIVLIFGGGDSRSTGSIRVDSVLREIPHTIWTRFSVKFLIENRVRIDRKIVRLDFADLLSARLC